MTEMADAVGGVDSQRLTVEQVPTEEYEAVHTEFSLLCRAEHWKAAAEIQPARSCRLICPNLLKAKCLASPIEILFILAESWIIFVENVCK